MAIRPDREYRTVYLPDMQFRAVEQEDDAEKSYVVEGYATTYDDPYVLYERDGIEVKESISRDALVGSDMNDVIFLYNHEGMVFARQSNGTLELSSDDKGLHVRADLGSTEDSRRMFESIKAGLVTQMSWAFTIKAGGIDYDGDAHLSTIRSVKKVYDVSAVSIPANPNTGISEQTRRSLDGVIEVEIEKRRSERERAERIERIRKNLKGVSEDGNQ